MASQWGRLISAADQEGDAAAVVVRSGRDGQDDPVSAEVLKRGQVARAVRVRPAEDLRNE